MYKIIFRCEASNSLGMGHLSRCMSIAEELKSLYLFDVYFLIKTGGETKKYINNEYKIIEFDSFEKYLNIIKNLNEEYGIDILFFDIQEDFSKNYLLNVKKNILLATIDDPYEKRNFVDLAFYPPVLDLKNISRKDFTGKLFEGWQWIPLKNHFKKKLHKINSDSRQKTLLITMGGSDAKNLTPRILHIINKLEEKLNILIVIGKAFANNKEILAALKNFRHNYLIYNSPENMAEIMHRSDAAVSTYGNTSFELAACGVPAILFCHNEEQLLSVQMFKQNGTAFIGGLTGEFEDNKVTEQLMELLHNHDLYRKMSANGLNLIDTQGAARIAGVINDEVTNFRKKRKFVYEIL